MASGNSGRAQGVLLGTGPSGAKQPTTLPSGALASTGQDQDALLVLHNVLDELPSDYPIFVSWKRYAFDLSSFLVGGVATAVLSVHLIVAFIVLGLIVTCVYTFCNVISCIFKTCLRWKEGPERLTCVDGCCSRCSQIFKSCREACVGVFRAVASCWIFNACRQDGSVPPNDGASDDDDDDARGRSCASDVLSRFSAVFLYIQRGRDFPIILFVTMLLCLTLMYFIYGHPHINYNVSPVESLSPFFMYVVLMLIQAAKKQGGEAETKAKKELTKIFECDDTVTFESCMSPKTPRCTARKRIDAKFLEKRLKKLWGKGYKTDKLIPFLDQEKTFNETDNYWNLLRAMYPMVFRDGNVGEIIEEVEEAEADNKQSHHYSKVPDGEMTHEYAKRAVTDAAHFPRELHARAPYPLQPWLTKAKYCVLVGIHALIPPVWMAVMHPASFKQEIWSFQSGPHDKSSFFYGLMYTDGNLHDRLLLGSWTPEKWVIIIVLTSVFVQWLVVFNFLKYLDRICLEYQQCRLQLLIFRSTTDFGFASLSKHDQDLFTEEGSDLRICVEIEDIERTLGTNMKRDLERIQDKFCNEEEKRKGKYLILPYHFAPSQMLRPTGTCIWWRFRHCLKVAITGKKVNLEIVLSITFGLVLGLACAAISSVFIQKTFTVSTVLALYDLIVIQAFMFPAINACVFLGDFLKSDSDLIDTVISRLDCQGSIDKNKELLTYMKSKIDKHEKRPELFGFEITPEFRSRFMTVGGLGAIGTVVKTVKHYLSKLMTQVASTTAEEAAKQHNIKGAKQYGDFARAAAEKVANGRRLLRGKISVTNVAELLSSVETLPSVAHVAAIAAAGLGLSSTSGNSSAFDLLASFAEQ